MAERESLIEALHRELEAMRAEVQQARSQATHTEDQLRLRINDLESTIAELVSVTTSCTIFFMKLFKNLHQINIFWGSALTTHDSFQITKVNLKIPKCIFSILFTPVNVGMYTRRMYSIIMHTLFTYFSPKKFCLKNHPAHYTMKVMVSVRLMC